MNVIDHYAYWNTEAIKADLDKNRHDFSILCTNLGNDFNIATVIRNSNAFLGKEVIIWGKKQYDRRGTVGTHNYEHFKYFKEEQYEELMNHIKDYHIVAVDNIDGAQDVSSYKWPQDKHVLMCFGQEQIGLPKQVLTLAHDLVYIKQFGSVRSLNVGTAAGIMMYDYTSKLHK